ncbi:MAG TPA: GNAT family N-acetyltransferase, partial [Clostridiales bacterium]|nr:GNAT family N-acetyltransferase [Clostridiales bacterium]
MEIRMANNGDIPGIIDLLLQVGEVHHKIRPDLFRAGAQKYDAKALEAMLQDPNRPI